VHTHTSARAKLNHSLTLERSDWSEGYGKLVLPNVNLNGTSGRALDELYLKPLGLTRKDAWLCDIIPETRLNPHQKNAINRTYKLLKKAYNLPKVTVPEFRQGELDSEQRRQEILKELIDSQADTLILLGDLPIKWFLNYFSDTKCKTLASFGETPESYGLAHEMKLVGKTFGVIPLCHPRQAQRLGASSKNWFDLHSNWVKQKFDLMKNEIDKNL
jgi:uracil-DNA glycosylase